MEVDGVRAEFVHVGGVRMDESSGYAVIVDRISHEMPFYRAWLKSAMLAGTEVINNSFWSSADDKFFNYALAAKLGVAVPRTVLLPHKQFPPQINTRSVRNLEYPLDWDGIFEHVGFPAFLKPYNGGGGRDVLEVRNRDEFFHAYDQSGDLCMTLQTAIKHQEYFRCFVVGQSEVRVMTYDPAKPYGQSYDLDPPGCDQELLRRMERDAVTLCQALGYDLNTVEFAVEEGIPYAIDFMNPVPDADLHSVGEPHFRWIVEAMARLAVRKAQAASPTNGACLPEVPWAAFLAGAPAKKTTAKSDSKKTAVKSAGKKRKPDASRP